MRAGGQQPDADAAADPRPPRLVPADGRRGLLDIADQIGVERLAATVRPDRVAGQHQVALAQLERIDSARRATSSSCDSPIHCR